MVSNESIFTEINKLRLDLTDSQVAELSKFPPEVLAYIGSIPQNFITFDIIYKQCEQYASKKNLPLNEYMTTRILNTIKQREIKQRKLSRTEFIAQYNMLFNDNVKDYNV